MVTPYDIVKVPDPVLKETAQPVQSVTSAIQTQIDRMKKSMLTANGIGLAANQVGLLNRVFVLGLPDNSWEYGETIDGIKTINTTYRSGNRDEEPTILRGFINPEIIWQSEDESVYQEGCLSIPTQYADIIRPARVRVSFLDEQGTEQEEEFAGLDSHAVQHEIDHLNGTLFIDYLSTLKRNMILTKVKKYLKNQAL